MPQDITSGVVQIVSRYAPKDFPVLETSELVGDLQYDELDKVMLLIDLEDKFDLDIGAYKLSQCKTVADVIEMLKAREAA